MQGFEQTVEKARALGTDPEKGLTTAQVEESRRKHGDNRLPEPEQATIFQMFLEALKDKTLLILMGAAGLAIGVEVLRSVIEENHKPHYIDGLAILAAIAIASLVATINQARAQKEFTSLRRLRENVAIKVMRNGQVGEVSIFELVVGDVIYVATGDRLPADGALLRAANLSVDESMLTGESVPVDKGGEDSELKAGSTITGGSGVMLATAVGRGSEIGKIQATLAESEESPTPLQERLSKLADQIGMFGLVMAILTFLALTASGFYFGTLTLGIGLVSSLLSFAIIAVTIVVVAVPEGLPLAVTISLAYSVHKMAKDKCLVRKLEACETMGAATVVCSDKTGTLTRNRMTVARGWINGKVVDVPTDTAAYTDEEREALEQIAAINATAFLDKSGPTVQYLGNPTECALLAMVEGWGADWHVLRNRARVVHQFSFSSDRKRMSTLIEHLPGKLRLLTKGAPEVVLGHATMLYTADGIRPLTDEDRKRIIGQMEHFSSDGLRTLGLAYRDMAEDAPGVAASRDEAAELLESELVFLALIGISDPVRPEVAEALKAARAAGVEVKMVTGDNQVVAEAISKQLSLLGPNDIVMLGSDFRAKSDEELSSILPKLRILARSSPSDKHRLVRLLKEKGEVVAVTGDGTNDATALREADVGFSMGLSGTEVAKEASNIVLLDDNFASIVRAIHWGRSIFENVRKFLQFQLTVNVVALTTAFFAGVFGYGTPLNTVQLLWVNLLMDSLAALALAAEPPRPVLLKQTPHGRHAPLISKSMWTSIIVMGAIMVAVLFVILMTDHLTPAGISTNERNTLVFNTFVMMQLFNEINARATKFGRSVLDGLFESKLFISVLVSTTILQILIIEAGGAFFRTVPLSLNLWMISVGLGASVLVVGFILRAVGRAVAPGWDTEDRPASVAVAGS